jgi:hypothetical protein
MKRNHYSAELKAEVVEMSTEKYRVMTAQKYRDLGIGLFNIFLWPFSPSSRTTRRSDGVNGFEVNIQEKRIA